MKVENMRSRNQAVAIQSVPFQKNISFASKPLSSRGLSQDSVSIQPKAISQISFTSQPAEEEAVKPLFQATVTDKSTKEKIPVKITELNPNDDTVDTFFRNFLASNDYRCGSEEHYKDYFLAVQLDNKSIEPKDRVLCVAQVTNENREDPVFEVRFFSTGKNYSKAQNYSGATESLMAGICQIAKDSNISEIQSFTKPEQRELYGKMGLFVKEDALQLNTEEKIDKFLEKSKESFDFKPDKGPLDPSLKEFTLTGTGSDNPTSPNNIFDTIFGGLFTLWKK